jgi:hypothetical protein
VGAASYGSAFFAFTIARAQPGVIDGAFTMAVGMVCDKETTAKYTGLPVIVIAVLNGIDKPLCDL